MVLTEKEPLVLPVGVGLELLVGVPVWEELSVDEALMERLAGGGVEEVILATGSDVEGEATAHYLSELVGVTHPEIAVTRLAQGLPAGGGLESADELTLMRAISGRRKV